MATLEKRVGDLEVTAGATRNKVLWVSWKPSAPADEITGATVDRYEWQRKVCESESDFQQRVIRGCGSSRRHNVIWCCYDKLTNE